MNTRDNSKEENIEHFYETSNITIIITILMVLALIGGLIYYLKFHKPSTAINFKYLNSSTSPGFDLTYTPNL